VSFRGQCQASVVKGAGFRVSGFGLPHTYEEGLGLGCSVEGLGCRLNSSVELKFELEAADSLFRSYVEISRSC
jgi:hypothetical protein